MIRLANKFQSAVRRERAPGPRAAFTLVEIILAIGLATVLLLVALTFYHQAAEMRRQVLREAERVSTMRLVMDRLAADLRGAQPKATPGNEFTGSTNSMTFVKEACTVLPGSAPATPSEVTDLVRISLTTLFGTNETGPIVKGLDRSESPLTPPAASVAQVSSADEVSVFPVSQANVVFEPFADIVRFVRFRYWDGIGWQLGWTNASPPAGVEIVLSMEAPVEDAELEPEEYPPDSLRRVVVLPGALRRGAQELVAVSTNSASAQESK